MSKPVADGTSPRSYGVGARAEWAGEVARLAERIRLAGYAVLPSGLAAAAVEDLGSRLEHVMVRQADEFGGPDRLAAIGDALTARCPVVYDQAVVALAAPADLLAVWPNRLGGD